MRTTRHTLEEVFLRLNRRPPVKLAAVAKQARIELLLTVRRGESLLVTVGIPVGILVFFSKINNDSPTSPTRWPSWCPASSPWPSCRRRW